VVDYEPRTDPQTNPRANTVAPIRPAATLAGLISAVALALASVACSPAPAPSDDTSQARPIASASPKSSAPKASTRPPVVPPRPAETPALVCARAKAARTSLTTLANMSFDGIAGAQGAITGVRSDLDALHDVVRPSRKKQVTALSSDVAALGKAVDGLERQQTSPKAWELVRDAATRVGTSAERLRGTLVSMCPDLRTGGTVR
jgi:hypothetical protein